MPLLAHAAGLRRCIAWCVLWAVGDMPMGAGAGSRARGARARAHTCATTFYLY